MSRFNALALSLHFTPFTSVFAFCWAHLLLSGMTASQATELDPSFVPTEESQVSIHSAASDCSLRSQLGQGHKDSFFHLGWYSNGIVSVLLFVIASDKKHCSGRFSLILLLNHCLLEEAPEGHLNFLSCWVIIINVSKSALSPVDSGLHSALACKGPSSLGRKLLEQLPL